MSKKLTLVYKWYREAWHGTFMVFGIEYEMPKVSLFRRLWVTTKLLPMIWKISK